MSTESFVASRLADVHTRARLEPLAVSVDQTHQGNGNVEQRRGDPCVTVESLLRLGVQQASLLERPETPLFVCRYGCISPAACFTQHPGAHACAGILFGKGPDQPVGDARLGFGLLLRRAFSVPHQHDRNVFIDCTRITTQGTAKLECITILQSLLQQDQGKSFGPEQLGNRGSVLGAHQPQTVVCDGIAKDPGHARIGNGHQHTAMRQNRGGVHPRRLFS